MSDYYSFACPICKEMGGFFTRQMWGWGNCDIVETFRFITYHVAECRAPTFDVIWEQDERAFNLRMSTKHITDWAAFPHSDDWETQQSYGTGDGPLHSWWTPHLARSLRLAEQHNDELDEEKDRP